MKYIKLSTPYFQYSNAHNICFFKLFEFNYKGYIECIDLIRNLCFYNFHFNLDEKKYGNCFATIENSTLYPSAELSFENFSKVKIIDFHAGGDPYMTMELIEKD